MTDVQELYELLTKYRYYPVKKTALAFGFVVKPDAPSSTPSLTKEKTRLRILKQVFQMRRNIFKGYKLFRMPNGLILGCAETNKAKTLDFIDKQCGIHMTNLMFMGRCDLFAEECVERGGTMINAPPQQ